MLEVISKHMRVGDWIFEVKMVKALKVDKYGQPYSAVANCNINGDTMYIDGLLSKEEQNLTRDDFMSFNFFCHQMGVNQCTYQRFQNGQSVTKKVAITAGSEQDTLIEDTHY